MLLLNALSLNMIKEFPVSILVAPVTPDQARVMAQAGIESAVGHADTAAVFGNELGAQVRPDRRTVTMAPGDIALVGQYRGPRLPEGATSLPEGATIQWLLVTIQ